MECKRDERAKRCWKVINTRKKSIRIYFRGFWRTWVLDEFEYTCKLARLIQKWVSSEYQVFEHWTFVQHTWKQTAYFKNLSQVPKKRVEMLYLTVLLIRTSQIIQRENVLKMIKKIDHSKKLATLLHFSSQS